MQKCWIRLASKRIGEYVIIEEDEHSCLLKSFTTNNQFRIHTSKVFKNKDDLLFNTFVNLVIEKKNSVDRIKFLNSTKRTEFKKRFILEYPDKLI